MQYPSLVLHAALVGALLHTCPPPLALMTACRHVLLAGAMLRLAEWLLAMQCALTFCICYP